MKKVHSFELLGDYVKFIMSLTEKERKITIVRWIPKGWDRRICPKCDGKGYVEP